MAGRIIFLNGASSAGKTTLAKTLQDSLPDPWFHLALDQFRDGMPGRYRGMNAPEGTPGQLGMNIVPIEVAGKKVTDVQFGRIGQNMLEGMHQAIAAFADAGNNVIIDDLILQPETLTHYVSTLARHWILFVAVRCPLEVLNKRESLRPGRFPGTAQSHYQRVHAHGCYDLEVDSSQQTAEACAAQIAQRLAQNKAPAAFRKLHQQTLA